MEKTSMTIEEFNDTKAEMIRLADEMWETHGYPFWITYPVNLNEPKYEAFRKYSAFVIGSLYWDVLTKNAAPDTSYELLPEWYMDPTEPCASIGWRMGSGESYVICLQTFLDSLTEEEQEAWNNKYPVPPHFDIETCDKWFEQHPELFEE